MRTVSPLPGTGINWNPQGAVDMPNPPALPCGLRYQPLLLSLGSNTSLLHGDPLSPLRRGVYILQRRGLMVLEMSNVYLTEPWGPLQTQRWFYNIAILTESSLEPHALLNLVKETEKEAGRLVSSQRWGPREIDIDIVLYGNYVVKTPELTIPHKYMTERLFVLEPLCEIAPNYVHPVFKKTVRELYEDAVVRGVYP